MVVVVLTQGEKKKILCHMGQRLTRHVSKGASSTQPSQWQHAWAWTYKFWQLATIIIQKTELCWRAKDVVTDKGTELEVMAQRSAQLVLVQHIGTAISYLAATSIRKKH